MTWKKTVTTLILSQKLNFLQEIKACVSSQKILSQKEAEFILAGKEDGWSYLLLQD